MRFSPNQRVQLTEPWGVNTVPAGTAGTTLTGKNEGDAVWVFLDGYYPRFLPIRLLRPLPEEN